MEEKENEKIEILRQAYNLFGNKSGIKNKICVSVSASEYLVLNSPGVATVRSWFTRPSKMPKKNRNILLSVMAFETALVLQEELENYDSKQLDILRKYDEYVKKHKVLLEEHSHKRELIAEMFDKMQQFINVKEYEKQKTETRNNELSGLQEVSCVSLEVI